MHTPLQRLTLNSTNRPLDSFTTYGHNRYLDDQDYQRDHVWGTERRRNLIKSLLLGLPIGAIILNRRLDADFRDDTPDRRHQHAVIDGKQRIAAIRAFTNNEFTVPAHWFPHEHITDDAATDDGTITWDGLTLTARSRFENTPIPVSETCVPTLAEERMIFHLINYGGVPQGDTDHTA